MIPLSSPRLVLQLLLLVALIAGFGRSDQEAAEQVCDAQGNCNENDVCEDTHTECGFWASKGECDANPNFMIQNCQKACEMCGKTKAALAREISKRKQKLEDAEANDITETPYGVSQEVTPGHKDEAKLKEIVANMSNYMEETVFKDPGHSKCAPSCQTCHLIDFDTRCPYNASEPTILNPGDVDKLFERLTTMEFYEKQYTPKIHSMPVPTSEDIPAGPWVVTLENFLTDEECDRLIELGGEQGYDISKDVGPKKFDGSFEGYANNRRTSTNAWCEDECFNDTMTQSVLGKIENATGVPDDNSEYLQLLRYEVGQFYRTHHDYIAHHTTRQEGVRILTVFLYLNDVEAGGGTDFPKLGITVQPKRGRALIWPSVKNEDPNDKDPRTDHQALPVEKGLKFGANAWLHQRNFKEVFKRSCH